MADVLGAVGQAAADMASAAVKWANAARVVVRTLEAAVSRAEDEAAVMVGLVEGYAARLDGAAERVTRAVDGVTRRLGGATADNYADAPAAFGGEGTRGATATPPVLTHEIDGHGDPLVTQAEAPPDGGGPWRMDDELHAVPGDDAPAAPALNGEVIHSNGHGTYMAHALPRDPSHEDAEARHAMTAGEAAGRHVVEDSINHHLNKIVPAADGGATIRAAAAGRQQATRGKRGRAK